MKNKIKKQIDNLTAKIKSWQFWKKQEKGNIDVAALKRTFLGTEVEAKQTKYITFSTFQMVIILASVTFLVMPFVTTFNEVLTRLIMKIELYQILQNQVVPAEASMIVAFLRLIGIDTSANLTGLSMLKDGIPVNVFISWNCIGWQSFILLLISMFVGLKGPFTLGSKIETMLIGILGTIIANIIRIGLVVLIAYEFGQLPAIIFHDYVSTIFIICWLISYWLFCYRFILHHTDFVRVKATNNE
ncbi:MAG: exosortase/archaeosortase family protein [Patescibacteria group bacterium]